MRTSIALFMLVMFVLLAGCGDGSEDGSAQESAGGAGSGNPGGGGIVVTQNGICLDGSNDGTPYILTVGLPCAGSLDAFADSQFEFISTVPGDYTISLTNTQSDLSWELSVDASFNNLVCDNFFGANDEICSTAGTGFTLTSTAQYFLLVREWDNIPSSFNLLIQPD